MLRTTVEELSGTTLCIYPKGQSGVFVWDWEATSMFAGEKVARMVGGLGEEKRREGKGREGICVVLC